MTLLIILLLVLLGSAVSVGVAALFLLVPDRYRVASLPYLISVATGTLLAASCLGLLPRALAHGESLPVMGTFLAGLVVFFVIEKLVVWRHCHDQHCNVHTRAASLILLGDATHNFLDGVAIAAATVTSVPLGLTTAIAVTAHEIPQEMGDFAILLSGGFSRWKGFRYNLYSSLAALPGALIAYYFTEALAGLIPYVMGFSAASFLYIAVADLIPASHTSQAFGRGTLQVILMVSGILLIALIIL